MKHRFAWAALLFAAPALTGCALLSKSDPVYVHYFTADLATAEHRATAAPSAVALRLGHVSAGAEIRSSLAVRSSSHELTYAEENRWAEMPDAYLRRALSRRLFEDRRIRRIISGPGPTLDVELIAFEEVKQPPMVRAGVVAILTDERVVRLEKTTIVERPLPVSPGPNHVDASIEALSFALNDVVEAIADDVSAELARDPPPDLEDKPAIEPARPKHRRTPSKERPSMDSEPVSRRDPD